ncbi:MAG: VanW family protein [Gaiella sp.]
MARRAVVLGVGVGVVAVSVGLFFAGSPERLASGTLVAGLDVGGLTLSEARSKLERRADRVEHVPVTFVAHGQKWRLAPSQLGVRPDWDTALAAAVRQSDGVGPVRGFRRIRTRVFGTDVLPTVTAFPSVLGYTVAQIAKAVDRPPVAAAVVRTGLSVRVVPERNGRTLDRERASATIVRSLGAFERGSVVNLPIAVVRPRVTPAELTGALDRARLALSAPVTLKLGPTRWRLPRWRVAQVLSLPARGATETGIGGREAERWLDELRESVDRAPVDATFAVRPGGIALVTARDGRSLDVPATLAATERALFSRTDRTARLVVRTTAPERSTAEARAMGITGVVGSYTTSYGGTPGRIHNVQLVADLIDGTLISPGATFSFNETTGERNAAKGFEEAPVIINGELRNGIGGGVCQVSTTVFNTAFEAGLPIARRTNHALYIDHYPLGRDATVNYPDLDLAFSNDTGRWLLLRTFVNAGSLTVNLYGASQQRVVESTTTPLTVTGEVPIRRIEDPELLRGSRVIESMGTPPRETSVTRRVRSTAGDVLYENTWRSYYVAEPRIVRVGTKPKPRPEPPAPPIGRGDVPGDEPSPPGKAEQLPPVRAEAEASLLP